MANLRLRAIELEGFRSYHDKCVIEFTDGVNVIIGKNGAGKTSIIEAAYFALSGDSMRGTLKDMYNVRRKNVLRVRLHLKSDRGDIVIERERPNTMYDKLSLNQSLMAVGSSSLNAKLVEIMGVGRYIESSGGLSRLLETAIVPQGELQEIAEILSRSGKDKKEWIDSQLGLRDYEIAYNQLANYEVKIELEGMTRSYSITDRDYARLQDEVSGTESKIAEKRRELQDKERELLELQRSLEEKRRERDALAEKVRELEKRRGELEELRNRLIQLISSERLLSEQLSQREKELRREEEELRNLLGGGIDHHLASNFALLREAIDEKLELEGILESIKGLEAIARESLQALNELERMGERPSRDIKSHIELLIKALNTQESVWDRLQNTETRIKDAERNLRSLLEEVDRLLGTDYSKKPSSELVRIAGDIAELFEELSESITVAEAEAIKLREIIKSLYKPDGVCPVCGRPLTDEQKSHIVAEAKARLEEFEERGREVRKKRDAIGALLDRIKRETVLLESILRERESQEKELRELIDRFGDAENLRKRVQSYERLRDSVERLRHMANESIMSLLGLERGEVSYADIPLIAERFSDIRAEMEKRYADNLSKINGILNRMDPRARRLIEESLSNSNIIRAVIKSLEEKTQKYALVSNRLDYLRDEVNSLRSKLQSVREEIGTIKFDEREYTEVDQALRATRERVLALSKEVGELEGKIHSLKKIIDEKAREIEKMRRELSALKEAKERVHTLLRVRTLYHRDNVPSRLRQYALSKISEELNSLLQIFNLNYREAILNEDVDISLVSSSGTLSLSQLSGGERIVVALSFLLALRKTVEELLVGKKVFGFLVLDEPTIHLDEDRRASLIELLREFQGGRIIPQLIIVTHEEELKESGENIILVENNGLTSTVKSVVEGFI